MGFSMYPAGSRNIITGSTNEERGPGKFWTSTYIENGDSGYTEYFWRMVTSEDNRISRWDDAKKEIHALNVRCIRD